MTQKKKHNGEQMSFNATWSMAVGGMVGGGIFSVLGVIIDTAGQWAWLSFVIAGLIALVSAHSYSQLSVKYSESGGAYTFLRELKQNGFAATLSWILMLGYILTVSVYAFTFGHYVSHVFGLGNWLPKTLAFAVITFITWINLLGVKDSSRLEIITVWGKLFILLALSLFGIIQWNPQQLTAGIEIKSWHTAIIGAATIFMAYEGFQLLSYDYDDIKDPKKNMPRATISAVIAVMFVYVMVAVGATMLVGASGLIEQKEVALSIAGQKAFGLTGLILITIGAAFSTGSAINATLFSTARLMQHVAEKKDLPGRLAIENKSSMPYFAIILIAALASVLAIVGSLSTLVDAASLIFLLTFGIVNFIAFVQKAKYRFFCLAGFIACLSAIILAAIDEFKNNPIAMFVMIGVIISIALLRPVLNKKFSK